MAVVALVVLVPASILMYLQSSAGERRVRRELVDRLNAEIAGRLEAKDLALGLTGAVVLEGVAIYDPEGLLVARIGELEAQVDLDALLTNHVRVKSLSLQDGMLDLVDSPRGLNLVRAFEPKRAAPAQQPAPPSAPSQFGWDIEVEKLTVSNLDAKYRASADAEPAFAVEDLGIEAGGRYRARESRIALSARGALAQPLKGALALDVAASGGSKVGPYDPLAIQRVELRAGASVVRLSGSFDGGALAVAIDELKLAKDDARAFAPNVAFAGDLAATGKLTYDGARATVKLDVPAGAGALALSADAQLAPLFANAELQLKQADLSAFLADLPSTALDGAAKARFEAGEPAPGKGHLELKLDASRVRGERLESLRAVVDSAGEAAQVRALDLELPGGTVSVAGKAAMDQLDLRGALDAANLKTLLGTVARMAGAEAPDVAGKGALRVRAVGPLDALAVRLTGTLDALRAGAFEAQGLRLEAMLPDARHPLMIEADVAAKKGVAGNIKYSNLKGSVRTDRRNFTADLSAAGMGGIQAHLAGELDADQQGMRLDQVGFVLEQSKWQLAKPARVDLRSGARVDQLVLESGPQRIEAAGGVRGMRLDVTARIVQLDLAQLPSVIAGRELGLGGTLELEAKVGGSTARPEGEASLAVSGGAFGALTGIDAKGKVSFDSERARGSATVARGPAAAEARFDVPLALLDAPKGSPLEARLEVSKLPLAEVGRVAGTPELAAGTAGAIVTLTGTSDQPRLEASGDLEGVQWAEYPGATVRFRAGGSDAVTAHVQIDAVGGEVLADAKLAASVASLSKARADDLPKAPLELKLQGRALALEPFAGTVLPENTGGRVSFSADLTGTAEHPRGDVKLALTSARYEEWRDLIVQVQGTLGESQVQVRALADVGGQRVGQLSAEIGRAAEQLASLDSVADAPLQAKLAIGPADLGKAAAAKDLPLEGRIEGTVSLHGTLAAPDVVAQFTGSSLELSGQPMGTLEAALRYAASKATLDAALAPPGGGAARVQGWLQADLGLRALQKEGGFGKAPLEVTLKADRLDLQALSTLPGGVQKLGGILSADATLTGTPNDPTLRGKASLKQGRVTIEGYGSYRDIDVEASLTERSLEIPRLYAKAGPGQLMMKVRAERPNATQPYQLTASATMEQFPVTVNDQIAAFLTGSTASLTGQLQGLKASLDLRLNKMVARLPELGGKELQELQAHPEIQVVREQPKQKAAKEKRQPPPATAAAQPAVAQTQEGGLDLKVRLVAPRDLWVESNDIRIEAGADLGVVVTDAGTLLNGEIVTRQGRVEVIGRKFEVARGRINYSSDPPTNPRLDVIAMHKNEREQVLVKVTISGTAAKPRIEMSSEPPLPESEIATLIATGRRELKRGSGGVSAGGGAASVLGSFVADRLKKAISSQIPLDLNLQVEMEEGNPQKTRVEAGTYIGDRFYVGYRRNLGAETERGENTNEARIEYQVSPRVTIESEYGDGNKGGADVVYSKDY